MLKANHRNNFSKINAGIIAEILENYFNDPSSIPESDVKIISEYLSSVTGQSFSSKQKISKSTEDTEYIRKYGYIYAQTDPLNINNINPNPNPIHTTNQASPNTPPLAIL